MMSKGGSLAVGREVKKNKAALKAAKQVVAEKSLDWQSGLRHYENEEPCSEEIGLLSDATAVFNYASKVENSRTSATSSTRHCASSNKVNKEAASSIDELEMKIKVGKEVYEHKLAEEVEQKKHALSSDEDDKAPLGLTVKPTPKKQKKYRKSRCTPNPIPLTYT